MFVLGALTGLKLEWKSPPRDAQAVGWREALRRIGALAAPAAAIAVLALPIDALAAPHIAPLLASMLLAVPLAVLSSHPKIGAALRGLRMLWVPDERRPARTLLRALEQRGFADLVPLAEPVPPRVFAPARGWATARAQRIGLALATAGTAFAVALTPEYAVTPELPISLDRPSEIASVLPMVQLPTLMSVATTPTKRLRAIRDERPARMIDDAVRERAREAVQRTLLSEDLFDPA